MHKTEKKVKPRHDCIFRRSLGLKLNHRKTMTVAFISTTERRNVSLQFIATTTYCHSAVLTYLGVKLDRSLTFRNYIDTLHKILKSRFALFVLTFSKLLLPIQIDLFLFKQNLQINPYSNRILQTK